MDLCDRREIQALLERHGFRFSKAMGQNFLIEGWVPRDIADASGADEHTGVLEIGPGIGPLTAQLVRRAGRVVSVELDERLYPVLRETMADAGNFTLIEGDAMKLDFPQVIREHFAGLRPILCANLPYNITTPVITALLQAGCFASVTVMIQKEVAQRICAQAGTAQYGAFTLLCQYYADCELLYDVPPSCFLPAPKVTSSVIRMTVRGKPPVEVPDETLFFQVVRAAFAQRRKTLVNALSTLLGKDVDKSTIKSLICACNLTETVRGERLSFADFAELTQKIVKLRQK